MDGITSSDTPSTSWQCQCHLAQSHLCWGRGWILQDSWLCLRPLDSLHHPMMSRYHQCFGGHVWSGALLPCEHAWLDLVCQHSSLWNVQQTWGKTSTVSNVHKQTGVSELTHSRTTLSTSSTTSAGQCFVKWAIFFLGLRTTTPCTLVSKSPKGGKEKYPLPRYGHLIWPSAHSTDWAWPSHIEGQNEGKILGFARGFLPYCIQLLQGWEGIMEARIWHRWECLLSAIHVLYKAMHQQ